MLSQCLTHEDVLRNEGKAPRIIELDTR